MDFQESIQQRVVLVRHAIPQTVRDVCARRNKQKKPATLLAAMQVVPEPAGENVFSPHRFCFSLRFYMAGVVTTFGTDGGCCWEAEIEFASPS